MKIRVNINELKKKLEFELSERKRKVHSCTEVVASWQRRKRSAGSFISGINKSNEIPLEISDQATKRNCTVKTWNLQIIQFLFCSGSLILSMIMDSGLKNISSQFLHGLPLNCPRS